MRIVALVPCNHADARGIDLRQVLRTLDTGLYIGNLWYLNFSDRSACRLTGMTRFASFWVEGGQRHLLDEERYLDV